MSSSEWRKTNWGDLVTLEYGKSLSNYQVIAGNYPVYGTNGRIGFTEKPLCFHPSVVIGRKGAYRGVHYSQTPFYVIDTAFYIKPKTTDIDLKFAYYFLLTVDINNMDSGSAIPSTSREDFYNLKITLPTLPTQRRIAEILGSLDDKIELNRRMNETLEAIARAIFKSWFVDFDPVKAKAAGRQPAGMDAETAALFPDSMDGDIPRGWRMGKLSEDFNLTMGQSPPGQTYNEVGDGLPFFQGRTDFGFRFPTNRVYCTAPTRLANNGDTLISVRAPVGDINMATEKCALGRGVAAVRHKTGSRSYTYYSLKTNQTQLQQFEAEGTVFGAINKNDFQNLAVLIPEEKVVYQFEKLIFSVEQLIENNEKETISLTKLRDAILPRLMNGEIAITI